MRFLFAIPLLLAALLSSPSVFSADSKTVTPASKPTAMPPPEQAAPTRAVPAPPPVVPPDPAVTSAAYGDWTLRCVRAPSAGQTIKTCEVLQEVRAEGRQRPIIFLAIGRIPNDPDLRATALTPTDISIPGAIRVAAVASPADTEETAVLSLRWSRCLESGCFADNKPSADQLTAWRSGARGRLTFTDAAGRSVAVPLSWLGLDQALSALGAD